MTWLIIILVVAVIIGPIMYLIPTAKDKRLSELRRLARLQGMNIELTHVPKLDPASHEQVTAGGKQLTPQIPCAAYRLPIGEAPVDLPTFMLLKMPSEPTLLLEEVMPDWALDPKSDLALWRRYNGNDHGADVLQNVLSLLPDDVLAIAIEPRFMSCYWRERAEAADGAVESIASALGVLREDLLARF